MSIRPDLIETSPHGASLRTFCTDGVVNTMKQAFRVFQDRYQLDALWTERFSWNMVSQREDGKTEIQAFRWHETMWTMVKADLTHTGNGVGTIRVRIPRMTERASFVVDGLERVPIAQIVPSPGLHVRAYERRDGTEVCEASIRPSFGHAVTVRLEKPSDDDAETWTAAVGPWKGWPAALADQLGWEREPFAPYARLSGVEQQPAARALPLDLLLYLDDRTRAEVNQRIAGVLTIKDRPQLGSPSHSLESFHVLGLIKLIEAHRRGNGEQIDPEDLSTQQILLVGDHLQQAIWRAIWQWSRRLEAKRRAMKPEDQQRLVGALGKSKEEKDEWTGWIGALEALMQEHIDRYLKSSLVQFLDRTNPLAELSHKRKVTRYGPGGLSDEYRDLAYRDVHPSHYGRLCPVETPETLKLGLTLHLAAYARVEDHQIKAPFQWLAQGNSPVWLSAAEEAGQWTRVCNGPAEPKLLRSCAGAQELAEETGDTQAVYEDASPGLSLGLAASLIPFIQHDDVNRALMGAKNMKQALPLKHPDLPLVQTGFEVIVGNLAHRLIRATCNGRVNEVSDKPTVQHGRVVREAGILVGDTEYPIPETTEGSLGSRLSYRPVVTVGQEVKRGEVLAEGPAMVGESLALGVNLLVAYLPWYGYTFEDGIVISDRLVRDEILTSLHEYRLEEELQPDEVTGVPSYDEAKAPELGVDGLIEHKARVHEGTVLARFWRQSKREAPAIVITHRTEFGGARQYLVEADPRVVAAPPGVSGTVEDVELVQIHGRRRLRVIIREERRVTVGDKLMGRHGNKGVITRIVPEAAMPHLEDGTPVDLLLNPLGVVGRLNLGQVLETHVGLVVKKKGEPGRLYHPFQPLDRAVLKQELASCGFPDGKAWLRDGWTGKRYDMPVVVGYQYFVKLNHLAEEKEQARDTGAYAPITQQAVQGRVRRGGQRVGEMEAWALLAHQAEDTLAELCGPKADDLEARTRLHRFDLSERWKKALRDMERSIPESFRVTECFLRAMGLSVTPNLKAGSRMAQGRAVRPGELESIMVRLASDEEIQRWGPPVKAAPWYTTRKWGTLSCGCEGYYDEILLRQRPNLCRTHPRRVTLTCTCPKNPVGPSDKILTKSAEGKLLCARCGTRPQRIKVEEPIHSVGLISQERGYAEGGLFCEHVFGPARAVRLMPCGCRGRYRDLVKEVQKKAGMIRQCTKHSRPIRAVVPDDEARRTTWGIIPLAEPVGHPLTRTKSSNGGEPAYAAQLHFIPVLPPSLRPHGPGTTTGSDVNWLYERVIRANNAITQLKGNRSAADETFLQKAKQQLQRCVDELMVDGATDHKGRKYRSILEHLRGKWGLVRHDLLGRRVDGSGRAVIVGAPSLRPDQVALPRPMMETLFARAVPEALAFIRETDARVLLNRQPSLHRYNLLALRPVAWGHPVIGLPPLITPGFNADFDGDTMACYVPVLARSEAERMSPERHVRSAASGGWMLATGHELAAGVYMGTRRRLPALLEAEGGTGVAWTGGMLREFLIRQWERDPRDAIWLAQAVAVLAFGSATRAGLSFSHFDLDPVVLSRAERPAGTAFGTWKKLVREKTVSLAAGNPIKTYLEAGTKLTEATLTQLAGGRGEFPRLRPIPDTRPAVVTSNLHEGMHPLEFFTSAHGSRSSLSDKKLAVAYTGTFTRHLVHAAFDLRIVKESCSDSQGIWLSDLLELPDEDKRQPEETVQLRVAVPLWHRLIGRVAISDVPGTAIRAGKVVDELTAQEAAERVFAVQVRSALTCQAGPGKICAACYGWEWSTERLPEEGLWAGILAGQSLGERATQLTFRTFHTGGAGGGGSVQGFGRIRALFQGQKLDVPLAEIGAMGEEVNLYTVTREWEHEQARQPRVRRDLPQVTWKTDPGNAGNVATIPRPVLTRSSWPDSLSRTHLEFHGVYQDMVHEVHAEVILRALKDAGVTDIRKAARRETDPLGALAFGSWQAFLKKMREEGSAVLPLDTPRSWMLLGWSRR